MSTKMTHPEYWVGCWIDDSWGQYTGAKVILKAMDWGCGYWDVVDSARRVLRSMGPAEDWTNEGDWEIIEEAQYEVVEWMNENVAPEGFSFEWSNGEFFFQSDEWWAERNMK